MLEIIETKKERRERQREELKKEEERIEKERKELSARCHEENKREKLKRERMRLAWEQVKEDYAKKQHEEQVKRASKINKYSPKVSKTIIEPVVEPDTTDSGERTKSDLGKIESNIQTIIKLLKKNKKKKATTDRKSVV